MKTPATNNYLLLLIAAIFGLSASISAMASQLDSMAWASDSGPNQVVSLKLDDHPGYVISESGNGSIIELTLKGTQLSPGVGQLPPKGIVRSSTAAAVGDTVVIKFLLTDSGRVNVNPVDSGFEIVFENVDGGDADASGSALTDLRFSRVSGDRVQVDLAIVGASNDPAVFKTVEPPRIAFDFYGVKNNSGKNVFPIRMSSLDSIVIAEDDNRMRLVLNLHNPVDYGLKKVGTGYVLTIGANASGVSTAANRSTSTSLVQEFKNETKASGHKITSVDFRRTPNGGGRIIIGLSDSEVAVDLQEFGSEIVAVFTDTGLPSELEQRLDVLDFATPVSFIDTYVDGSNAKMVVSTGDRFKQSSVQSGSTLVLDISPLTQAEEDAENVDEFGYVGERLSLNFQRISTRAALQVLADFTGLNFVTSDAIGGNLSLRLKDVPWDQALDVIMLTKGLAMRQTGNVIWVAPAGEILAKERQALASQQELGELEPLVSELIRVSYARVEDIAKILKSIKAVEVNSSASIFGSVSVSEVKTEENSLLSPRGSVTVDERTNSVLVQDTASKLIEIREVIAKLDIPVRQVQIETRIVEASDDFSRTLGARLGYTRVTQQARFPGSSNSNLGDAYGTGSLEGTNSIRNSGSASLDDALSVNLPASAIGLTEAASYAFSLAKIGSGFLSLLDLEISALQAEGKGRVLANPKLLTTDKRRATIEQGEESLTVFGTAFGTASTTGQKAVLSLSVLPQITPDDKVIMDVDIKNDSFIPGTDKIATKRINTQALLENGETVVIGGIYTQEDLSSISKVPILGDLPLIGYMFRKKSVREERNELLIFLTPRIIDPALAVQ
jgi:type IV pilus assembly protein PilQ